MADPATAQAVHPMAKSVSLSWSCVGLVLCLASALDPVHSRGVPGARPPDVELLAQQADMAHHRLWAHLNATGAWGTGRERQRGRGRELGAMTGCVSDLWMDLSNWHVGTGWVVEAGHAHAGEEGWLMDSQGRSNTRAYFNYEFFNTPDHPTTHVTVWMRGAPDPGKNSNVYLMEPMIGGIQDGSHDEIDLVEVYGTGAKAECTVFKVGREIGPMGLDVHDPGNHDYVYELYLQRGKYLRIQALQPSASRRVLTVKELWGVDVPDRPMRLYAGIWDCSIFPDLCPGDDFPGLSQMCLKGIWIDNC